MTNDTTLRPGDSAVTWAREHGERFAWWTLTNRYDITDRRSETAHGTGYRYIGHQGERGIVLVPDNMGELRDATRAVYIVDDGASVEPWYVAGWQVSEHSPEHNYIMLHAFPRERDDDGAAIMRGDRPDPVDFRNWALTPERFYHVKVFHNVTVA